MSNLFTNLSGSINAQVVTTLDMVTEEYKLTYTCKSIGSGKSFLLIKGVNTYFFPLQFVGQQEVKFKASLNGVVTCVLHGDAEINNLTLSAYENVSEGDKAAIELVKTESSYWDRVKNFTNDIGKVKAEMLEGLINLTVNAFANESGTITQENGIMTFLNGSTPETSTMAVQITGGAIRISNNKDAKGEWIWTTAISGAGINAQTIIAETFKATTISGATIEGGTITGARIEGQTVFAENAVVSGLEVGKNVTMGANATISWEKIEGAPNMTLPDYLEPTKITQTTVESPKIISVTDMSEEDKQNLINRLKPGTIYGTEIHGSVIKGNNAIYSGDETSSQYMEILDRNIKGYGQDIYGNKQEIVGIYTGVDKGSISLAAVGSSPASMQLVTDVSNQSVRQCGIHVNSNKPFYIRYNTMFIAFDNKRITIQPQGADVYVAGTLRADKIIDVSRQQLEEV